MVAQGAHTSIRRRRGLGKRQRSTTVHTLVLGLLWTFIRTDFKSRYHGTIGGFLWALLKPAAMFVVLLTVFSFVFNSDDR